MVWKESRGTFRACNDGSEDREFTIIRSEHVEFGMKDGQGRIVGGFAEIEVGAYEENQRAAGYASRRVWNPEIVKLSTRATRDGEVFGAIPRATRCASIAEAKLLGAKKLRQAQKRQEERSARGEL